MYVKILHKNSLPYFLISKIIPTLERRINNILRKIVDFTNKIELIQKTSQKYINFSLVRENTCYPIYLGSGFEKFIGNIIIKIGIRTISKIPKSNFIIIDEGFGNFDTEHLCTTLQKTILFLESNI